ncbi:MAG: hypothetical protein VX501_04585 [Pseudomonadota bacterium]|nr:hypothetical protein [Pseudomonadota bacterium]
MYATYVYAAVSVLAASIILFGYWFHRRRELGADAVDEWEERSRSRTKTVKGVDRETFLNIYVSGHEPRWALYACGTLLIALLTTPVIGVALMMLWPIIVLGLDGGPWYDVGYYPWMFYMFFGMCFSWAGVAFLMARLHHARRPEPFNAALARARGEPLDEVVIPRKRPAWAKKVRPLATDTNKDQT